MSVSRGRTRAERVRIVVSALQRLDTPDLRRLAGELGIAERTLWRYRSGDTFPSRARLDDLERRLGLNPWSPDADRG